MSLVKRGLFHGSSLIRSYLKSPLSATVDMLWIGIGSGLWIYMAGADINLIANLVFFSTASSLVLSISTWVVLNNLLAKKHVINRPDFKTYMISVVIPMVAYCVAVVTGFFFSSFISGDWPGFPGIPSACYGWFHTHHWEWGFFYSTILFVIMMVAVFVGLEKVPKYKRLFSRVSYSIAFILGCLLLQYSLSHGWFPRESGLWRVALAHITYFLVLGTLVRSRETSSVWFIAFLSISLGIVNGVFIDGFRGIQKDYPNALIYSGDQTGCGTRLPFITH